MTPFIDTFTPCLVHGLFVRAKKAYQEEVRFMVAACHRNTRIPADPIQKEDADAFQGILECDFPASVQKSLESGEIIDISERVRPEGIEQTTYMTRIVYDEAVSGYERYGVPEKQRLSQIAHGFAEAAGESKGKMVIFKIPTIRHGKRILYPIRAEVGQNPDGSGCITLMGINE